MEIKEARDLVLHTARTLLSKGLVIGSMGNFSVKIDTKTMLITPSGRTYTDLTPEEIVKFDLETLVYEGRLKPSSEYRLHAAIYAERPEIRAIVHTHQPYASAMAAAHRELPPFLDDMVQLIGPSVRVAEYAPSGSSKMTINSIKALDKRFAALLANHGAICIGRDMEEAVLVCEVLEKGCKAFIHAELVGGIKMIDKPVALQIRQDYLDRYSKLKNENR
jgi:L-fuculose-phosphate aldolase